MAEFSNKFLKEDSIRDIKNMLIFLILAELIIHFVPAVLMLRSGSFFNDLFFKNLYYWGFQIILLLYFAVKIFVWIYRTYKPKEIIYLDVPLFDFERGLLFQLSKINTFSFLKLLSNPIRQMIIGYFIISVGALLGVIKKVWLTALPPYEQQVLIGERVLFDVEPAGGGEILPFAFFTVGLIMAVFWGLKQKYKWDNFTYWTLTSLASYITAIPLWMLYHYGRYGTDDVALAFSGVFAFIGVTSMLLFGGVLVWWLLKDLLNLTHSLIVNEIASSDVFIAIFIPLNLFLFVLYLIFEYQLAQRKKRKSILDIA